MGQTQSLSTHSSIQPAYTTDMHGTASITYTVNFPEAHSLLSIWYVHTLACILANGHTQSHIGVPCPWEDPTHCFIKQLCVCLNLSQAQAVVLRP